MRASWRRDLDRVDTAERASNHMCPICESYVWQHAPGKSYVVYNHEAYHPDCLAEELQPPFVIGQKVRRIDEPYVVLHVREIDTEGTGNDQVPKALCFNSYGHGRWMPLVDLEAAS